MNTSTSKIIGSVVWMHGPNPKRLPFMAYIASVHESLVECYMVHEEEFLATADDLVYDVDHHTHYLPLVIQPRLSAEIPISNIGQTVTYLDSSAVREISQMTSGVRRAAERTGILIRSEDEFRWDHVMFQKRHLDAVLDEIDDEGENPLQLSLLMTSLGQSDAADVALRYLITLMREGSWSLLNLSDTELRNLGIPGLAAEFIGAAATAAAGELLKESEGKDIDLSLDESIVIAMKSKFQNSRVRKELTNV